MDFIVIFVLLSFLICCTVVYLSFCVWRLCRIPPETQTFTRRDAIRSLLDPHGINIKVLLRQRALPNKRLARAFGINSTFTSESIDVHHQFRKHTMTRLRNLDTPENWQTIRAAIKEAVDVYLPSDPIWGDYATYMQAVVFVTVLAAFFDNTLSFPERTEVRFVTEGINQLWTASKSSTCRPTSSILAQINRYLHTWLPDNPADPFHETPLELILPAYETLWRLVAHTFTYVEGTPGYIRLFLDFFNTPTATQFAAPGLSRTPSAQDILQEVLRLHPPTKRIKRSQNDFSSIPAWIRRGIFGMAGFDCYPACSNILAADIEALQRSSVWGPSPHEFDAMRHRAPTEAQRLCFIPFGLGPLKCVASSLAPRLAGMIVAGVAIRDDIELTRGKSQGSREGWGEWRICRKG